MLLEGKPAHMIGEAAWKAWAAPIIAALGPCPYGILASDQPKVKKQTTRMLKCECGECQAIWRTSGKVVAQVLTKFEELNATLQSAHDATKAKALFEPRKPFFRCIDPLCTGGFLLGAEDAETGEDDESGE